MSIGSGLESASLISETAPSPAAGRGVRGAARLNTIDAMRGLAALAVTWFHLTNGYPHDAVGRSGGLGWLGVDCFFVISGFVIPYSLYSYAETYRVRDFGRFLARRMLRLEPPFIASIFLVLILNYLSALTPGFAGTAPQPKILQILSHLLYVIPLTKFSWLQPVYWSLAYEFVFYIVVGLTFSVLWPRHLIFTIIVGFAAIAVKWAFTHEWDARLALFLFGISTARYYLKKDGPVTFGFGLAAPMAAMLLTGSWLSALVGLATAMIIARPSGRVWAAFAPLGAISYSLYLTHVPIGGRIINLGRRFGHGPMYEFLLSAFAVAASLLFAWLFYRVVEATAIRWSKRQTLSAGG
jgi:peptidoglycan/LPS O-acetylase OafA/YrhL